MDYVITTRELAMLAKDENIDFANLPEEDFDDFMGKGSGAGVILVTPVSVMEAAIRSAYALITKKEVPASLYDLEARTWYGRHSRCSS